MTEIEPSDIIALRISIYSKRGGAEGLGFPKIAIASESFTEAYPGQGVGIVIDECIAAVKEETGREPLLIGPWYPGCETRPGLWLPSQKIKRGYRRTFVRQPKTNSLIVEALRDIDIVHTQTISALVARIANLKRRGGIRSKLIIHLHNQADKYLRKWFGLLGLPLVLVADAATRFCLAQADLGLAPTEFFKEIAMKRFHPRRELEVWEAPIQIPEELPSLEEAWPEAVAPIPKGERFIAYVGRIGNEKNIRFLLDVFEAYHEISAEPIYLVLIGGGEIEHFRRYANRLKYKAGYYVRFTGNLPHKSVLAITREAACGITTSDTEVQGLGLLEQMLLGTPVIVKAGTYMAEPVGSSGGGRVMAGDNPHQWAKGLKRVIERNTASGVIGMAGRDYVQEHYSTAVQYRKLKDIYLQLHGG